MALVFPDLFMVKFKKREVLKMRSIKPGRGNSLLAGIVGIVMVGMGILMYMTFGRAAGGIFAIFIAIWTIIVIGITVSNFINAFSKRRFSTYDIVDHKEEGDPLNMMLDKGSAYCPNCGAKLLKDAKFCQNCGHKL